MITDLMANKEVMKEEISQLFFWQPILQFINKRTGPALSALSKTTSGTISGSPLASNSDGPLTYSTALILLLIWFGQVRLGQVSLVQVRLGQFRLIWIRLGPPPIVRERVVSPGAQTRRANKKFTGGSQTLNVHNTN